MLLRRRSRAFASALGASIALLAASARADKSTPRECIAAATEGQKLRDLGKLLDARAKLLMCASEACPADIRVDCGKWLSRVEETTPHVVFGARAEGGRDLLHVRVLVGGTVIARELVGREQALDPGPYEFVFESADGVRVTVSAVLRAGDAMRPVVATFPAPPSSTASAAAGRPPPPPPPAPSSPDARGIALVGTGAGAVLAAGAFVFFALHARSSYSDLERSCAPGCTDADTRGVRTDVVLANVTGIAALTLGAAFAGLALFTRPSSPMAAASASASPGGFAF